jgi:hypothetical protein
MKRIVIKTLIAALSFLISAGCFGGLAMAEDGGGAFFEDVPETHWGAGFIKKAVEEELMTGVTGNEFMPDTYVTASEFAALTEDFSSRFDAVGEETPDIKTEPAKEPREGDDRLNTPEEMAGFLSQMAGKLGIVTSQQYINLSGIYEDFGLVDPQYNGAMQTVYKLGLMGGTSSIHFSPKGNVTRAQAATVLVKFLNLAKGLGL